MLALGMAARCALLWTARAWCCRPAAGARLRPTAALIINVRTGAPSTSASVRRCVVRRRPRSWWATTLVGAYSEDAIAGLVARLEERREAVGVLKRTLLVLDDVVGEGVERSKSVLKLFTRGRHWGVFVCLSSQQANCALSPTFKANSRFIFFSQLTGTGMKRLCEDMVLRPPMRPSAFEAWVSAHCVDYAFGLYDAHEKALSVVRAGVHVEPVRVASCDDDSEL